jgi:TetR/AcrR family transcriptional regulator, copper-responsive repressor
LPARLNAAKKSGEIPSTTDAVTLAAFYAMVIQGMAVKARDGASVVSLKRMALLAMKA